MLKKEWEYCFEILTHKPQGGLTLQIKVDMKLKLIVSFTLV